MNLKIASSILAADFGRLAEAVAAAEAGGADWIHIDVMDGHFVPNITVGPAVVEALRRVTSLPLDVHLMIDRPHAFLEAFAAAGADYITVHQEAAIHLHRAVERIRELGARPGVSLNPATPLATLDEILPFVDMVLVMSVNPGFGGQQYISTATRKIADLRRRLDDRGFWGVEVEVDGGVTPQTISEVVAAGATVVVAGAAIFNEDGPVAENIAHLRHHAGEARPRPH